MENGSEFVWDDGSALHYTNWDEGSLSEEIGRDCVQMQSRFSSNFSDLPDPNLHSINANWKDTTCESENYVVCQKSQTWSFLQLQETLLYTRKELKESFEDLTNKLSNKLNNTRKELDDTRNELSSTIKELKDSFEDVTNQLNDTRNELENTKNELNTTKNNLTSSYNILTNTEIELFYTKIDLNTTRKQLEDTRNQLKDVRNELKNLKTHVFDTNHYFTDCPFSNTWSKCKILNDLNNNRKIIATPKNETEQEASWEKSMEICKKYDASLVAIDSEEKQLIFQSFLGLLGNKISSQYAYWTSGHRDLSGKFRWMNNRNELNYTNWNSGEPNNFGGDENCISTHLYRGKWNDIRCNAIFYVICEFSLNI